MDELTPLSIFVFGSYAGREAVHVRDLKAIRHSFYKTYRFFTQNRIEIIAGRQQKNNKSVNPLRFQFGCVAKQMIQFLQMT